MKVVQVPGLLFSPKKKKLKEIIKAIILIHILNLYKLKLVFFVLSLAKMLQKRKEVHIFFLQL